MKRIGICCPGGAAAYPSTILMTAIPAQVAGVEEIAVVAPPTPNGAYNINMLATCYEIGVREVYRVGGAQAVAAMAYGVEGLPKVDKIVGPGNLFVALAKKSWKSKKQSKATYSLVSKRNWMLASVYSNAQTAI